MVSGKSLEAMVLGLRILYRGHWPAELDWSDQRTSSVCGEERRS